jgi:hypothetical protein
VNLRLHIERLVVDEGVLARGERAGLAQAIEHELRLRLAGPSAHAADPPDLRPRDAAPPHPAERPDLRPRDAAPPHAADPRDPRPRDPAPAHVQAIGAAIHERIAPATGDRRPRGGGAA